MDARNYQAGVIDDGPLSGSHGPENDGQHHGDDPIVVSLLGATAEKGLQGTSVQRHGRHPTLDHRRHRLHHLRDVVQQHPHRRGVSGIRAARTRFQTTAYAPPGPVPGTADCHHREKRAVPDPEAADLVDEDVRHRVEPCPQVSPPVFGRQTG